MEWFIARENVRRFETQLVLCTDGRQRETLEKLLAAEKEKLQELESRRADRHKQEAVEIEENQSALRQSVVEIEKLVSCSDEMLARHHREREQNDNQGWPVDR